MERRSFFGLVLAGSFASVFSTRSRLAVGLRDETVQTEVGTEQILARIVNAAQMGQWITLPIGQRMMKIAPYFLDIPYVGGTLEGQSEQCRVDLQGLDCVTFFENVLDIARMIAHGGHNLEDLKKEVTFTRYRSGILQGYESRLHYTADWIADNILKKVVIDFTPELGGIPMTNTVNFMSTHPQYYKPLQEQPALIKTIAAIEQQINTVPRLCVPKNLIQGIENKLLSGDIVAIVTSKAGLDYAHTGLINVVDGQARFMHASSAQKKVVLDRTISEYVNSVSSHTGITVVRPL